MNESNVLEVNTNSKLKQVIILNHEGQGQPMKNQIPYVMKLTKDHRLLLLFGLSFTTKIKRLEKYVKLQQISMPGFIAQSELEQTKIKIPAEYRKELKKLKLYPANRI